MSQLSDVAPHWAGHLFGTNTGKLHLALGDASDDGASRVGLLRVSDDNLGVSTYTVTLSQANQIIEIRGKPEVEVEGIEQGDIEAKATFDAKGSLHGDWKSSIGTGGVFDLYPHLGTSPRQSAPALEQIYTSNRDLGALRLYRSDLS